MEFRSRSRKRKKKPEAEKGRRERKQNVEVNVESEGVLTGYKNTRGIKNHIEALLISPLTSYFLVIPLITD
jgi:hypothetical protein